MATLTESDLEKIHGENWPEIKAKLAAEKPLSFWQKLARTLGLSKKDDKK